MVIGYVEKFLNPPILAFFEMVWVISLISKKYNYYSI